MYKIGMIGAGHRVVPLARKLLAANADFQISAVYDIDNETAAKRMQGIDTVSYYNDAAEMLEKESLDGVIVGTRCSTHTRYALLVAEKGIPLFLEKPVCTTEEDCKRLEGILYHNDKTVVSFPLRTTYMSETVKSMLDSGIIGEVAHVQAYNNVNYARGYYHKWYRDENETGGLFLQKATHDFDYINYILGNIRPVKICAMKSKQVYKGDMPAGQRCHNCPKRDTCPEGPNNINTMNGANDGYEIKDYCCFAVDTGNEDSGSAIIRYENGMHVVYSQNFIARRKAGRRGARFIGFDGTLEFDFNTGRITVFYHNKDLTEEKYIGSGTGHFGGDDLLMKNFADVVRGTDVSHADLKSGILSAKMCLMARKSSETDCFYDI